MISYLLNKVDTLERRSNSQNRINKTIIRNGSLCTLFVGAVCIVHSIAQDRIRERSIQSTIANQQYEIDILKAEIEGLKDMKG